jgi:hypothetical protein
MVDIFGQNMFHNVALIFTHWSQSKKDRKYNNEIEMVSKVTEFNEYIKDLTGFDTYATPIPCFFIDNSLLNTDNYDSADEFEQDYYRSTLQEI